MSWQPFSASSAGCGSCKNPDFVAPGSHLQGLRVLNSWLDAESSGRPLGRPLLPGQRHLGGGRGRLRCGRARAAEVPDDDAGPRQALLPDERGKLASFDSQAQGAGEIRLGAMLNATPQWSYTGQRFIDATGTGSLERSRGQDHLTHNGVTLTGERDIFGHRVDTARSARAEAAAAAGPAAIWNGSTWSGSAGREAAGLGALVGQLLVGQLLVGQLLVGQRSGSSWSGSSWSGSSWSGSSWASDCWG